MTAYNLLYYTPKLWERVALWFCPLYQHESTEGIVWYKKFGQRLYICGYIRLRVVSDDTYTTGSNATSGWYDNAGNN